MEKDKDSFNKMVLLTAVKIVGILFSFAIPMYLGRKLSIETYGTYKQIMLFFWFSQVALNLGIDDSAYLFVRREPERFPLYSFNALVFNLLVTAGIWLVFIFFKAEIASLLKNPGLAQYLPLLGYLTLASVSSMQLEGILIGLNRFKERLALEMGMELLKSLSIIVAFFFFNSVHMVLALLSALMTLRLGATFALIDHYKRREHLQYRDSWQYFPFQAKFGLPLGISRIFQNLLNIENYLISSFFSLAQFTIYTVGCFENPLINAARGSIYELTNIEMTDAMKHSDYQRTLEVWRSNSRKLFLIVVPFVVYMIFFAREIITFVFSDKYVASVPFFMVFNLYLFVGALGPEPLFRATLRTHTAFKIKMLGVLVGVLLVVSGAYWGGPMYALVGKILGVFIINCSGLVIGARLIHSSFRHLFQWKELLRLTLLSLFLAGVLRLVFLSTPWRPFWILAASFSLYFIMHFLLSCWIRLIKRDEVEYLKSLLEKFMLKARQQF